MSTTRGEVTRPAPDGDPLTALAQDYQRWRNKGTRITTSNDLFNAVLDQSLNDLRTLWTDGEDGGHLAAGTPWFDTVFGRDSAITSLQMLAFDSRHCQANAPPACRWSRERDKRHGGTKSRKILHEVRFGETARTGEVPFGLYYGSIDSTPLFLLLAAEYWSWTADSRVIREILPAIRSGSNGPGTLAIGMLTVFSNTSAVRKRVCSTRAGRIAAMRLWASMAR